MLLPHVHCVVVEVPSDTSMSELRIDQPKDLLPWADPYIAQLLVKHQMQIAAEERDFVVRSDRFSHRGIWAEAPPPFERLPGSTNDPLRRKG